MTATDVKAFAEAIKAAVETLAIAVVGLWTAFLFHALKQRQTAEAQRVGQTLDNRKKELELSSVMAQIEVKVAAEVHPLGGVDGYCLLATASFENKGREVATVLFGGDMHGFLVSPVSLTADMPTYSSAPWINPMTDKVRPIESLVLVPGNSLRVSTAVRVKKPGVYNVCFRARASGVEKVLPSDAKEKLETKKYECTYSDNVFVVVGESSKQPDPASEGNGPVR
jgi:hypothetical protein